MLNSWPGKLFALEEGQHIASTKAKTWNDFVLNVNYMGERKSNRVLRCFRNVEK